MTTINARLFFVATAAVSPVLAQFIPGAGAVPVIDGPALLKWAEEIGINTAIQKSSHAQELWTAQVVLSKLPWGTKLPLQPQVTPAQNTLGEMATWTPAITTGLGSATAWRLAAAQLAPQVVSLIIRQNATLGSDPVAQLATIEAIQASGTNNLAILGQARGYLNTALPAMQRLQNHILSANSADNGPTQQMQYVAAGTAQANSTAVQNLQVSTGTLEAVTAISKSVQDAATADLNIQAAQQKAYLTQSTGLGGIASAFMDHP